MVSDSGYLSESGSLYSIGSNWLVEMDKGTSLGKVAKSIVSGKAVVPALVC